MSSDPLDTAPLQDRFAHLERAFIDEFLRLQGHDHITLHKLPDATAADLRARLDGIRRRPGAPSTSRAAATAAQFAGMGLGRDMPEPPLT